MHKKEVQSMLEMTLTERRQFTDWFTKCFVPTRHEGIGKPSYFIQELFQTCYPENRWTLAEIEVFLELIGICDVGTKVVPIITNIESLPNDKEIIREFLKRENDARVCSLLAKRLQTIDVHDKIKHKARSLDQAFAIIEEMDMLERFYHTWCVKATDFVPLKTEPVHWRRTPYSVLLPAFHHFCAINNYRMASRKDLLTFLETKGHGKSKGYACQKAGGMYVMNLYVPGCGGLEELDIARQYNMFVYRKNEEQFLDKSLTSLMLHPSEQEKKMAISRCFGNTPQACSDLQESVARQEEVVRELEDENSIEQILKRAGVPDNIAALIKEEE